MENEKEVPIYYVGEAVEVVNVHPLKGNEIAPPAILNQKEEIKDIHIDREGNQHLDLGYISKYQYISSYETGEVLPNSGEGGTHWVHPSRVKKIE
jgi:hypothetical protein